MFNNLAKVFKPFNLKLLAAAIFVFAAIFCIIEASNHIIVSNSYLLAFKFLLTSILFAVFVFFFLAIHKTIKTEAVNQMKLKFTQTFDFLAEEISMFDPKTLEFIYLNKSLLNNAQYEQNELLGQHIVKTNPDCGQEQMQELIKALTQCDVTDLKYETLRLRKDGSKYPIRTTLKYSKDMDILIAFSQDITKEKELENLKYQFISVVNHELRTPLTAISGSLKIILSDLVGEVPATMKEMVNVANNNATRLLDVINDLVNIEILKSKYKSDVTTESIELCNLVTKS